MILDYSKRRTKASLCTFQGLLGLLLLFRKSLSMFCPASNRRNSHLAELAETLYLCLGNLQDRTNPQWLLVAACVPRVCLIAGHLTVRPILSRVVTYHALSNCLALRTLHKGRSSFACHKGPSTYPDLLSSVYLSRSSMPLQYWINFGRIPSSDIQVAESGCFHREHHWSKSLFTPFLGW